MAFLSFTIIIINHQDRWSQALMSCCSFSARKNSRCLAEFPSGRDGMGSVWAALSSGMVIYKVVAPQSCLLVYNHSKYRYIHHKP